ncbi:MAG: FHA domain-containing protein [Planctomycetota bacterium]|nr:MAG: FHA domain-containing protein [Planctomycetota bacterium]
MIGQRIGDYVVTEALGEGGMGMVYKGQHVTLGQVVAIKSLHSSLMNNQAAKDRFVREAQALARLNHPNIIGLKNFINDANGCFIIMEYAEGEDLEHKLQRMGLIPPEQCIPWFIDACRGLEFAHRQNIIHRDIKPSNIMVHPSGVTKLLDFGTAKLVDAQRLTQQGMTLGTVIYMSKEQLLGKPLDARSDVYSLGVTLYECVTGQLPFYDEEERKLVVKIAKEEPIPPSQHYPGISKELEAVILKAMQKDPANRFQSAAEMEQALSALLGGGRGVTASTVGGASVPPVASAPPVAPSLPAPAPVPGSVLAPGAAPRGIILSPLFLAGVVLWILGFGGGLPVLLVVESTGARLAAAVLMGLSGLLGLLLVVVAFLQRQNSGGAASVPVSAGAPPPPSGAVPAPGSQHQAKPTCPTCGRALLVGMTECPFCHPQAAPAAAPAPQPFNPGGTLNINSQQQQFPSPVPSASAPAGSPSLQVIDGNDKGLRVELSLGTPVTIGRAPSCGLTLNDPGVSGTHAAVVWGNDRQIYVEDRGSRNGVFVNNQKVQRQTLKGGDLIVVGSTRLLVHAG